ncbi:MAG: hypothetical protein J6B34_05295 [Clostridia bacterium]|nr:hypothetical protein [Clostridia bacterium]
MNKVIDTHLHIETWKNEEFEFINCFEEYRRQSGVSAINSSRNISTKMSLKT